MGIKERLTGRAKIRQWPGIYTDWDAWYGYGWMTDQRLFKDSKAHQIVYHPGTDFGFYTMFARQPDIATCLPPN